MHNATLYETDFNEWVQQQITLLKQGKTDLLDVEHLVEELAEMGKTQRRELSSHLKILIAHLLKWQYQLSSLSNCFESYEGKSWRLTILEQRSQINDLLEEIPSLKRELSTTIEKVYPKAVLLTVKETRLVAATFPIVCPYSNAQLLDDDFYPSC